MPFDGRLRCALSNHCDGAYRMIRSLTDRSTGLRTLQGALLGAAAVAIVASAGSPVGAADLGPNLALQRSEVPPRFRGCQQLRMCDAFGACTSRQVCGPVCPDGYSCSPLYGAYGPYGGVSYWGGYTNLGWE
jgi:hypothetical protein